MNGGQNKLEIEMIVIRLIFPGNPSITKPHLCDSNSIISGKCLNNIVFNLIIRKCEIEIELAGF